MAMLYEFTSSRAHCQKTLRQGMSVVIVGGSNGASINQYWLIYVDLTKQSLNM